MNGDARKYTEVALPTGAIIDIPMLVFRGATIRGLAVRSSGDIFVYVPMFEHAQLCPGLLRQVVSPVERLGDDTVFLGKRAIAATCFRYRDKAVTYWIDQHDLIVKRLNSFKQQEIAVRSAITPRRQSSPTGATAVRTGRRQTVESPHR